MFKFPCQFIQLLSSVFRSRQTTTLAGLPLLASLTCAVSLLPHSALAQPQEQPGLPSQAPFQAPLAAESSQACPDLTHWIRQTTSVNWTVEDWAALEPQLRSLQSRCLRNVEYYALLGAAQLNSGRLVLALESLERALLLDPQHGGAQIDYAQALFRRGELFSALSMNQRIIDREDLPTTLRPMLTERQRQWRSLTKQRTLRAEVQAGYDNNLNGAPTPSEITLTLSGEDVLLVLDESYQAISGPYMNARLSSAYREMAPSSQQNWMFDVRGRISEDEASDLVQLDGRYAYIRPSRERSWQVSGGLSHLMFGGKPLYTAAEASAQIASQRVLSSCTPFAGVASQYQLFHNLNTFNAIESKITVGVNCQSASGLNAQRNGGLLGGGQPQSSEPSDRQWWQRMQWTPTVNILHSEPIKNNRPGNRRTGWQISLDWRLPIWSGTLNAQFSHTEMDDSDGYNPSLANNAEREIDRSYALIQYRLPVTSQTTLQWNAFWQRQHSNLDLFKSRDRTLEFGVQYRF
ncbi:tetratricopeptide repeat protein [Pseudohongiella nitratireducens]|uniref:tetratricopeptide repeat protein n=1 Tax=Pseudohongiella nitratireducens TaxID=1768907 RepID=UPI00083AF268|nr:tetratricopeptide repeat protein [Pseudohongiella nitratireducens]